MLKKIKNFISEYWLILLILIPASFLRLYRLGELLGFYFDQGRDALVIWDLIHNHKFFLIGPTTGIAGIFRGPWYYWLITPFYWVGRGDPTFPAIFLAVTAIAAIALVYLLGVKIHSKAAGIFSAIVASFSFYLINASRWLSNPTPMLLLSVIIIWAMLKVTEGKKWGWPVISFCFGLSLFNFGSSGELFYFPAILIFAIWQKKNWPNFKNLLLSIFLFFITFAPLVIFDLKHQGILHTNFINSFVSGKSFAVPSKTFLEKRVSFLYDNFTKLVFDARGIREKILLGIMGFWFIISTPRFIKKKNAGVLILLIVFISPVLGLLFFQGNEGVLYGYYLTGYYLIFTLIIGITLGDIWKHWIGKIFVVFFIYLFLTSNLSIIWPRLSARAIGPESIVLANQEEVVDWIYKQSENKEFNADVYVPPVIPYAYDYLFKWLGSEKYNQIPQEKRVSLLFTVYEIDPDHPERLKAWLDRQKGIGRIIKENRFNGIVVQERQRILIK